MLRQQYFKGNIVNIFLMMDLKGFVKDNYDI